MESRNSPSQSCPRRSCTLMRPSWRAPPGSPSGACRTRRGRRCPCLPRGPCPRARRPPTCWNYEKAKSDLTSASGMDVPQMCRCTTDWMTSKTYFYFFIEIAVIKGEQEKIKLFQIWCGIVRSMCWSAPNCLNIIANCTHRSVACDNTDWKPDIRSPFVAKKNGLICDLFLYAIHLVDQLNDLVLRKSNLIGD